MSGIAGSLIERDITLTCVSNEVGGPYVSSARWLGVPFTDSIERVGVQPGVDQVFSTSLDSGYTCSTPFQAVSDGRDAMIVVGMNGQPLPDERGFPPGCWCPDCSVRLGHQVAEADRIHHLRPAHRVE